MHEVYTIMKVSKSLVTPGAEDTSDLPCSVVMINTHDLSIERDSTLPLERGSADLAGDIFYVGDQGDQLVLCEVVLRPEVSALNTIKARGHKAVLTGSIVRELFCVLDLTTGVALLAGDMLRVFSSRVIPSLSCAKTLFALGGSASTTVLVESKALNIQIPFAPCTRSGGFTAERYYLPLMLGSPGTHVLCMSGVFAGLLGFCHNHCDLLAEWYVTTLVWIAQGVTEW